VKSRRAKCRSDVRAVGEPKKPRSSMNASGGDLIASAPGPTPRFLKGAVSGTLLSPPDGDGESGGFAAVVSEHCGASRTLAKQQS
jgi:hypothetical protein